MSKTKIVLNRQSDLILDGAQITAPVGIVLTDVAGAVDAISAEEAARKEADDKLQEGLSREEGDRISAVSAEEAARIAGDADLQSQMDNVISNIDPRALDSLSEIVTAFQTADGDINNAITTLANAAGSNLSDEAARAIAAEAKLTSDLSDEVAARIADVDTEEARAKVAEAKLTSDLSSEEAARIAAVDAEKVRAIAAESQLTSDLSDEVANRIADVDAEEARAIAAEAGLKSDLSSEEARAIAAEAGLTSDLSSEVANRIADVDAEEARALAAEAGLKSDINVEKGRIDAILDGSDVNLDQFKEVVAFVESIDMTNDNALLTAVSGINDSISKEVSDRTADVDAEESRAKASEGVLTADLSAEVANRIADVDAEEARAKASEGVLTSDLAAEKARAIAKENAIDAAYKAADVSMDAAYKAADSALQSNINTEAAERLAADNTIQANLNAETSRAQGAEAGLSSDLSAEAAARIAGVNAEAAARIAADSKLTSDLSAEKARAIAAEGVLTSDLGIEAARAIAAEASLSSDLSDESARATAAEGVLQGNIDVETSRIDAILLASDADKDSFAEIVTLINSVDTTNDQAFAGYVVSNNAALSAEESRAMAAEASLSSDLSDEAARAISAEAGLSADLTAETVRATAAEAGLSSDISDESARATAAEGVLTSDLSTEKARAIAAEAGLSSDLSSEVANRVAGDDALQLSLDNEVSDRTAADQAIQSNLDAEAARATAAEAKLTADLSDEVANRTDAVAGLKSDLSDEVANRTDAVSTEEAARKYGDKYLQSQINNVISNIDPAALDSLTEIVAAFQTADGDINNAITLLAESASNGLNAEVARAEHAEEQLGSDLSDEITRAEEAEAAIIKATGYDEMGAIASGDYQAYQEEVSNADSIVTSYPGKIQEMKDRGTLLQAAMDENIFPVTVEGNEYVDAESLQLKIDDVYSFATKMIDELNTSTAFSSNFSPINIVNFESWGNYKQNLDASEAYGEIKDAEAGIITAVGYDEMGAIASGDSKAYRREVLNAQRDVENLPAKIDAGYGYLTRLNDAMAIGEFPVTVNGGEYADTESLQADIDSLTSDLEYLQSKLNESSDFLGNFGPANIVNFESWIDYNMAAKNREQFGTITKELKEENLRATKVEKSLGTALSAEVARAIEAEEGLDSKIVDIISNTDFTKIDSFSEVVSDIDAAMVIITDNAASYVVSNRPTMMEFKDTPDGTRTTFNSSIVQGTHIVFLNGLMQFEGRDYDVAAGGDQQDGGDEITKLINNTPFTAIPYKKAGAIDWFAKKDERSLTVEFYSAPLSGDVLNVYGVQVGHSMTEATPLSKIEKSFLDVRDEFLRAYNQMQVIISSVNTEWPIFVAAGEANGTAREAKENAELAYGIAVTAAADNTDPDLQVSLDEAVASAQVELDNANSAAEQANDSFIEVINTLGLIAKQYVDTKSVFDSAKKSVAKFDQAYVDSLELAAIPIGFAELILGMRGVNTVKDNLGGFPGGFPGVPGPVPGVTIKD